MSTAHSARLSTLDATFLAVESETSHMHVGGVTILQLGALRNAHGGVDMPRVRAQFARVAASLPRLHQKVVHLPGLNHWAWVDDERFDIDYHVRHTALPRPGGQDELERLAGRVFSGRLDRNHPLWEFWVVEGLGDDQFALVAKIHHCLLDGVGAVNLIAALAGALPEPETPVGSASAPHPLALLADEVRHRFGGLQRTLHSARQALGRVGHGDRAQLRDLTVGAFNTLTTGLRPASPTCINPAALTPHRRYAMFETSLAEVKAIRVKLGGTVNDVVLATVVGGLRTYLQRHDTNVDELTNFRALIPANIRHGAAKQELGNHVSLLLARLPIATAEPRARYAAVCAETNYLKSGSHQSESAELMEAVDDEMGLGLIASAFKLAAKLRSFNIVVTNVPGPPFSLDMIGTRVDAIYALLPLFEHQGAGIALFSYNGVLRWGINADWDCISDLPALVGDLRAAFEELKALADSETVAD